MKSAPLRRGVSAVALVAAMILASCESGPSKAELEAQRLAAELAARQPPPISLNQGVAEAARSGEAVTGPAIVAAARAGARHAVAALDAYVDRLGRAMAMIANIVDPDVFVLGGGMSNVAEIYDGTVSLEESEDLGGLLVRLRLPAAS